MEIKDRIKAIRNNYSLSQQDFADKLNVKKALVAHWETGRSNPGLENLTTLCKMFGVTSDYILFGVEAIAPEKHEIQTDGAIDEIRALLKANSIQAAAERKELAIQNRTMMGMLELIYAEVTGAQADSVRETTSKIYASVRAQYEA